MTRPVVWVGRVLLGLVCSALLGWMALAIYFDFSLLGPPWLRAGFGVLKAKSHINERAKAQRQPTFLGPDPGGTSANVH